MAAMCQKQSFAGREISAPVTLSRLSRPVGQEFVVRGRQEGQTIPAIGVYGQVTWVAASRL